MAPEPRKLVSSLITPPKDKLLPEEFWDEAIIEYDVLKYPFRQTLLAMLQEPPDLDLDHLHETRLAKEILLCFRNRPQQVVAGGCRGNPWNRRFIACAKRDPPVHACFMKVYHDFLRDVVLPHLGTGRIAFQSIPTFRCHLPHFGHMGRPHRDEDYRHPPCEVNFWIPVTTVFGSNSLFAESRRGVGDFRPFDLREGQLMRFYGNQVWHYAMPNETDNTRVSLDFRVIREEEWSPDAFDRFKLGAYYSVLDSSGILAKGSTELQEICEKYGCTAPSSVKKPKSCSHEEASQAEPRKQPGIESGEAGLAERSED